MQLFVKTPSGRTVTLAAEISEVTSLLKLAVAARTDISDTLFSLQYNGKPLANDRSLEDYNIQNGSTLQALLPLRGGGAGGHSKEEGQPECEDLDSDAPDGYDEDLVADPDTLYPGEFEVHRDENEQPVRDERGFIIVSNRTPVAPHPDDMQHATEAIIAYRILATVRKQIKKDIRVIGFDGIFATDSQQAGSYVRDLSNILQDTFWRDGNLLARYCDYTGIPLRHDPGPFVMSLEGAYGFATVIPPSGPSQLGYHATANCFLVCETLNFAKRNQTPLVLPLMALWMRILDDASKSFKHKRPELEWCYNALQNAGTLQHLLGFSGSHKRRFDGVGSFEGWRNLRSDQQRSLLETARTGAKGSEIDSRLKALGSGACFSIFAIQCNRSKQYDTEQDWKQYDTIHDNLLRIAGHYNIDEESFLYYCTITSSSRKTKRVFYPFHVLSRPAAEQVRWDWDRTFSWVNAQLRTLDEKCDRDAKAAGVQEQGRDTERMIYMMCHVLCRKIAELLAEYPRADREEIRLRILDRWGLPYVPWICHPLRLSLAKRQDHGIAMETGYRDGLAFDPVGSFDDACRTIAMDSAGTNHGMKNHHPSSWDNIRTVFCSVPLQHPLWSVDDALGMEIWGSATRPGQFSPQPPQPEFQFNILLSLDPWLTGGTHDLHCACCETEVFGELTAPDVEVGRGILTTDFSKGELASDSKDMRPQRMPQFLAENRDQNVKVVAGFRALSDKKGCTVAQLALAWLLKQGDDIFPIPGTRRIAYLDQNWAALDVVLSDEDEKEIRHFVENAKVAGGAVPAGYESHRFRDTKELS
ncbi:hypothetical protein F4818DRAFT_454125 [Hypoxylon cercidicola]|nr:hypothetical protein F4818DRAFT_454125 [Hypoxylon cercidicola]